jgi:hypothetical protein
VQEAVAQALGLRARELAVEAQRLRPRDHVLGDQRQLEPHGVGGEVAEGEVAKPRVLGTADAVLDARVAAVVEVEPRDVIAALVGHEDLVAPAV